MKVTIVTVCFNSGITIVDTIRSVTAQSHADIEHLIIDGCSTDNTLRLVELNRHPKLILISEPDLGIYDAMNKGMNRASGEIIGFLNSDDLFADSEVLTRIVDAFEQDSLIEACYGDLVYVTADNSKVMRYWKSQPFKSKSFACGWCPAHPTFYIRRSAFIRLGNFRLSYRLAADAEFMMRYLEIGLVRSSYIPRVQVRMRLGGATNMSWKNIIQQNREILLALENNGIRYSLVIFILFKVFNRISQRFASIFCRGQF